MMGKKKDKSSRIYLGRVTLTGIVSVEADSKKDAIKQMKKMKLKNISIDKHPEIEDVEILNWED